MGNYRISTKSGRNKLLLPLSYGLSSTVLLRILDSHLEHQRHKHSGPGYDLYILVVEPSSISPSRQPTEQMFGLIQERFPNHSYTRIPFHSIFEHDSDVQEAMSKFAGPGFVDNPSLSHKERLDAFRASIPTATSKTDVDYALMNRLIVACAKKFGCTGILWGDSDSRLAAKTLASVAKGRGSSVTWQVSDGMSPFGIEFSFPLRDLFSTELQQYAKLYADMHDIIIPDEPPSEDVLTKNLSIDELMMRYVLTQGEKYPGVMQNVTRTASKLQPLSASNVPSCTFCGAKMGGSGNDSASTGILGNTNSLQFCYGCTRSRPDEA